MRKFNLLCGLLLGFIASNNVYPEYIEIKNRLPQSINSYQPAIVPISDFDDHILYFDRKLYFENSGGIDDKDETWLSQKTGEFSWSIPERLPPPINTNQSDVLFYLSPDGNTALVSGKYIGEIKSDGYSLTHRITDKWSKPIALKIKNYRNDSTVYSATLSVDLQTMILSLADSSSGIGGMDLYVSHYNRTLNNWSEPKSLGNIINTKQDEVSPYLAPNSRTLYFASNNPNTLGGFDLYCSNRLSDDWQQWTEPISLGKSINTDKDDNYLWLNALGDKAYIVSYDTSEKRQGIYQIQIPNQFRAGNYAYIRGMVMALKGNKTYQISTPQTVAIFEFGTTDTLYFQTNPETNEYILPISKPGTYQISLISDEYFAATESVSADAISTPKIFRQDIFARPIVKEQNLSIELYYDYNSAEIKADEKAKLDSIMKQLKNKKFTIYINAHTDTVGTENYNINLSKSRADGIVLYLLEQGISTKQFKANSLGESQASLDKAQALNRRVEIIIQFEDK